jgi:hypothetical protein
LEEAFLFLPEEQPAQAAAPVAAGGLGFQLFLMAGLANFFVAALGRGTGRPDFVTAVGLPADEFEEPLLSSIHDVSWRVGNKKRPQQV